MSQNYVRHLKDKYRTVGKLKYQLDGISLFFLTITFTNKLVD